MTIYSIYKATSSTSGKSYIGYTYNFVHRKIEHKSESFNTKSQAYKKHFYRAIRKYGWTDFDWEIIYQSTDQEHALEMETHFIRQYDTFQNGYNSTLGGDGGFMIDVSIECIAEDYNNTDLTLSEIADKNNCSIDVVITRLNAAGIKHPKNSQKRNLLDEIIIKDYQSGLGSPEIAEKYKVTPQTILYRLKKHGIKIRGYREASIMAKYPITNRVRDEKGRYV